MRPYHIRRLERLAHILDRVHETMEGRFNLGVFFMGNDPFQGQNIAGFDFDRNDNDQATRGTAGCALGWAGCDREFRKAGLRLNHYGPCHPMGFVALIDRKGDFRARDFSAAGLFFGIGRDRAYELFGLDEIKRVYHKVSANDVTARDVANAVRRLVTQLKHDDPKLAGV